MALADRPLIPEGVRSRLPGTRRCDGGPRTDKA